jgi:hypothetical protein
MLHIDERLKDTSLSFEEKTNTKTQKELIGGLQTLVSAKITLKENLNTIETNQEKLDKKLYKNNSEKRTLKAQIKTSEENNIEQRSIIATQQ